MPVAILLRTSKTHSIYRDAIIKTIDSGSGNYAILCSGFFQEEFNSSFYKASKEPGLIDALVTNKVQIDTIGVHNGAWKDSYIKFSKSLIDHQVNLVPYLISGYQWHAKVFILKNKSLPVFGIVGSSNITANAFGVGNKPALASDSPTQPNKFNYECDVYFWNNDKNINGVMTDLFDQEDIREQVILTQYDEEDNLGKTVETRLSEIEEQIFSTGRLTVLNLENIG